LRARKDDERGAILVMAAVGIVLSVLAAGLAVDLGFIGVRAREVQKVADLAAIDAVRMLPADPTPAAQASATRNSFPYTDAGYDLTVEWSDGLTGIFTDSLALLPIAAVVRVTATAPHEDRFLGGARSVSRSSLASISNGHGCYLPDVCVEVEDGLPLGTVRVGSTLASASSSDATLLNRLLNRTVGGSYNLSAVGWQGLAAGTVTFRQLRTALNYEVGTVDGVLDANLRYRDLLDATVDALNADGSPTSLTAASFLATIAAQVATTAGADIQLRNLFGIVGNVGSGRDVADAAINVKDIVVGGMILADSDHFATMDLTAADIPGLPGTSVTVKFGLIEAPQTASGPPRDGSTYRTVAQTAQVRLQVIQYLDVELLGIGLVEVAAPYYLEAGRAEAALDAIECPASGSTPTRVDILASTEAGRTVLGAVGDATLANPSTTPSPTTATLVNALGITVTTNTVNGLTITLPGNPGEMLSFSPPYTEDGASQQVSGTQLSLSTVASSQLTVTGTLLDELVKTTVANAINLVLGDLETSLLSPLYRALGLSFASADVWAPPPQTCVPTSFNTYPDPGGSTPVELPTLIG
jgi:uncharacterized membrane protein